MEIEATPAVAPAAGEQSTHVVLLACPGAGHVLPVIELARRIVALGGFTVTLVTYTNFSEGGTKYAAIFATLPSSISTVLLPEVSIDDIPGTAHVVTRIFTVVKRAVPHLRDLLLSLLDAPAGVAAFVPDLLCPWTLQAAVDLGVPRYIFFPSNLMTLSSFLHIPELDRTTTCEFRDLPELVRLPGCVPLHGADLVDAIRESTDPAYRLTVELGNLYLLADGFLVNTFDGIEHDTIVAFNELTDKGVHPPSYAVGPFIRPCSSEVSKHSCLQWLDNQPDKSVLYICFGTGGTLSTKQTAELAAGLEASGQRFLWVMQFPNDKDNCASFFGVTSVDGNSPVNYLPEGFVERTKETGLSVPLWAPQVEVLNHRATGGFLSHCGWNSVQEAAAAGVPTIAWPMYAEQRMNAVMMTERAGTTLRPRAREDGVVSRDEVAAVVRELLVGEKGVTAREKVGALREAAEKALAPDGASRKTLLALADKWRKAVVNGNGIAP